MLTMVAEENRPRRRTSTSVSPANGSLDLPCNRDVSDFHHDRPDATKNSSSSKQQKLSLFSTVLFLASLVLFVFYVSAGRWKGARSYIDDFLAGGNEEPQAIPSLGIVLHPEDHRSRNSTIITQHWKITSEFRAPDGVKKKVYLINGNFYFSYLCGHTVAAKQMIPRLKTTESGAKYVYYIKMWLY